MKLPNQLQKKLKNSNFFFYVFNTIIKVFFTIVCIRIITLRWIFHDNTHYPRMKLILDQCLQ